MTTASDIINQAAKDSGILGVGEALSAEDENDGLTQMNWMLDEWQRHRWLVFHLVDTGFLSTGAQKYTVGPGGNFALNYRPATLESAFFTQTSQPSGQQVSFPLRRITTYEEYGRIALKQLVAFSDAFFYDPAMPQGFVYTYPILPANIYTLHIITKEVLSEFPNLTSTFAFPPEYRSALRWNVAERMIASYTMPERPIVTRMAKSTRKTLRSANNVIAELQMPGSLLHAGRYNIYSDQIS